ncbi:polysaccharide biosynthesis protein [Odoribacter lunatus]|uniref:polysaccharide biosynthesis protein n=1 Tax=Odoribacter lunatus TaxID=2941335 RepID=UPI00203F9211|nr:polysaccharide biosynthesis protein [Odoribacter lunatus]
MLNNQRILITGGTGSFGQKFIELAFHTYPQIKEAVIFSRNPEKQEAMKRRFPHVPLRFICGDMAHPEEVEKACENVDIIIHTAALRIVPDAEVDPWGAVETNVIGAHNLIQGAVKHDVKQILALSTDMASLVNNTYGATKMLSDKLFIAAHRQYPSLKTSVIRYGNMFGSAGTVIPFFLKKAKEDGVLPVTDIKMTRFMATLEECVHIAFQVLQNSIGGEIIAPKIKSYNIMTVAQAVDSHAKIEIVGLRPGEKLYEEMVTRYNSFHTIEAQDAYIIIPPYGDKEVFCRHYSARPVEIGFEFNSENNPNKMTVEDIQSLIRAIQ